VHAYIHALLYTNGYSRSTGAGTGAEAVVGVRSDEFGIGVSSLHTKNLPENSVLYLIQSRKCFPDSVSSPL
jgi:hypothetical protein